MATKSTKSTFDVTKPLYAWVGAADLAVAKLRETDLTSREVPKQLETRLTDLQGELKSLPDKFQGRLNELQEELKALPGKAQARVTELQGEARELLTKLEARVSELRAELEDLFDEQLGNYSELAVRGRGRVAKLRDEASDDVQVLRDDVEIVRDETEQAREHIRTRVQARAGQMGSTGRTVPAQAAAPAAESAESRVKAPKKTPPANVTTRKSSARRTVEPDTGRNGTDVEG